MSLINEYRATEEAIKELQERLKSLEKDDKLKKELEFEEKLRTLMGSYGKSLRDILALLDPDAKLSKAPRAAKATGSKRARKVKQYKNPHNGEVIETPVLCRLDSDEDVEVYEAGGVLQRFAQDFLAANNAA